MSDDATGAALLDMTVLGVPLWRIGLAIAALAAGVLLRFVLGRLLRYWIQALTRRTVSDIDDQVGEAVEPPLAFVPVALSVFVVGGLLQLEGLALEAVNRVGETLIALTFFWALSRLVDPLAATVREAEKLLTPELSDWAHRAARAAIWVVGVATLLEIWGVRVLPIIAGFGLIGVAVALGAQDLFKNLIAGLLILTEKRFRVGDWVRAEGVVEGTVEAIGFRSTKIRQFDKAPVYVPNDALADGAVVNFGEMPHRRIFWRIGLEYRTSGAQLGRIRARIERLIAEDERFLAPPEGARQVRLDAFAASSIDILISCFTETRDWAEWLAVKEELLLGIKQIVEEEGAGFAFPSQSLYLEKTPQLLQAVSTASQAEAQTEPRPAEA